MTSSALLASVALSTVIFRPMVQVGCCIACSSCAPSISREVQVRNGPPLAVRMRRRMSECGRDPMHCRMAECSLSTGMISPPLEEHAAAASSPATTSVSLLARATRLPASSAASVASRPAAPTTALSTMSTSSRTAARTSASVPICQAAGCCEPLGHTRPTNDGSQIVACAARAAEFENAVSPTTRNRERCREMTFSAVLPMDPVDPSIATPLIWAQAREASQAARMPPAA